MAFASGGQLKLEAGTWGHERTCCGTVQLAAANAHAKRTSRTKPQPWVVRKLMVGVTWAIMGYAGYVYIGRLCVPMILRSRKGGRGPGIALLVIFSLLYLWVFWAYLRVVLTSPGYAKDYIKKSERPTIPAGPRESWNSIHLSQGDANDQDPEMAHPDRRLAGPSYEDILLQESKRLSPRISQSHAGTEETSAELLDSKFKPEPISPATVNPGEGEGSHATFIPERTKVISQNKPSRAQEKPSTLKRKRSPQRERSRKRLAKEQERDQRLASLNVNRRPPTLPVLLPVHRYCGIDGIVKPYRAHHCRICGTCVLKYDHHCPWIGQCVGARNHKFFYNFCQATSVITAYMFGTLLAYTVKAMNSSDPTAIDDLDPQEIVIMALAGLFWLFTTMLIVSHTRLIWRGQSTVESVRIHSMRERESRALERGFGCWEIAAKAQRKRLWNQEWGALDTDGNIWWQGSGYVEWVGVMGSWKLGWIFPVGESGSDGLNYPVNPRFDSEGRWRRREEWPEELRFS